MNAAYTAGLAYGVGFILARRLKSLAEDANTNNPYWVTTENGHHFLIDEEGIIQSGRFKGQPIGRLKNYWTKKPQKLPEREFARRKQYINNYKYAKTMPEKALAYIDSIIGEPEPTRRSLRAREEFNNEIDDAIKQQNDETRSKIERFELNPYGVTEINNVSQKLHQRLGLNQHKKIVLPLFAQKRALAKHPDMDEAGLRKGLAYCLMANDNEYISLKANLKSYSRLAIHIKDKTFGDLVIDLEERNRCYEIVHFYRSTLKGVKKAGI